MATVLIVDDSRTSRRILKNILDITMPVQDGLTCLKKIMAFDKNAKVIMVTAAGQKSKMVDAIKSGASEFIQKPFEPEQIISIIQTVV